MEDEIFTTNSTISYEHVSMHSLDTTNYSVHLLVADLYQSGDVNLMNCSDQNWLPLSQWITKGSQLKTLWIGLLQLADRFKTEATGKSTDDIQRFECIAFEYNSSTNLIKFREYTDICIDKDQWLGILTGLTSDLRLLPLPANNYRLNHFPYQKLIVPFRMVQSIRSQHTNHQTITINRSYLLSFAHQYFVFILNDRLKILQSTDSHTEWLYLALLHAMTSHPLSDQYTGMTGMRRAFQFLYSAGCWSDQPFDKVSLNILSQIASISPYS
ncbi:unnamed protein product [Rotaria sp. Silwood2]|nr:unnamed protein product [Rotaria sp. Silwood2]